jgi:hypothetical protein
MTNQGRPETGQSGDRSADKPTPFAEVMREEGMSTPAALTASMEGALGVGPGDVAQQRVGDGSAGGLSADDLLRAAETLLDKVLATQCENRDSALDLLTVDSLVTRAMEIAARDPQSLAEFPELAMKRIAAK